MTEKIQQCGIIMPISAIDNCLESHWSEVQAILQEVVESVGLKGNIVSYADEANIIQKNIIDNLYHNPIVICDVSGKNPNVMFELGMRLAFDKPTIIIKDDCTTYTFDIAFIEHLEYPRDLNYAKVNRFKELLAAKVKKHRDLNNKKGAYNSFLKNFGEFTVAKLDQKEIPGQDFIIEQLEEIRSKINLLERNKNNIQSKARKSDGPEARLRFHIPEDVVQRLISGINKYANIDISASEKDTNGQIFITVKSDNYSIGMLENIVNAALDKL